jgi:predicted nuclease of restriction endonuclease-like (RecB) superfamily
LHKGYKPKTCYDKNYLACAATAPRIKKSVVTNLCSRFNISEDDEKATEEDQAEEEHASAVPVGSKRAKPSKKDSNASSKKNSNK